MSLRGYESLIDRFKAQHRPWVALGGGGYDVANVVRAWTLAWAIMNDVSLPDEIPDAWLVQAQAFGVHVRSLRGPAQAVGRSAAAVMEDLDQTIETLKRSAFPALRNTLGQRSPASSPAGE